MSEYTIWLRTPTGEPLAVIDDFVRLEYRRVVNATGYADASAASARLPLLLTVPADALPLAFIGNDTRLEVWRTQHNATPGAPFAAQTQHLDTETVWFVRRVRTIVTAEGEHLVELGAVPALDLLAARIVPYPTGSSQATKTAPADDMMKAIVRENLGAAADSARTLSDWLDVAPDLGLAPVVSKSFAYRRVLDVLAELAEASAEEGTPLAFDVVSPTPERLAFRTYAGSRGIDHIAADGSAGVILSLDAGTLGAYEHTYDYEDAYTVVYGAGQGAEGQRWLSQASDAARLRASPFAWRERLLDARHTPDFVTLAAATQAALAAGRPRHTLRATVRNTPTSTYGKHWHWGDYVLAVVDRALLLCHIDELHVTVTREQQRIDVALRVEDAAPATLAEPVIAAASTAETEVTYQQVQRGTLPADARLTIPAAGHLLLYGHYAVEGSLTLEDGAQLVILT